jgi:hypothetical protein
MRSFGIPTLVTLLTGICVLLGLAIPAARGDFALGEPVNLKSVIPVLDPMHENIDCLSSDGLEIYVESDRPGGYGSMDLWVLRRASIDADWSPPENLGPAVNGPGRDNVCSISADGLMLYFNSDRPGGYGAMDIYMTARATRNAPWGQAVNLGPKINVPSTANGGPWISANGLELYFVSFDKAGGYGGWDIYVTRRATVNDPWGTPANLGPVVNSACQEVDESLSPDGLILLFSDHQFADAPRPGGYGGADMWMARRASLAAPWQTPVNLGPKVNSDAHEIAPRLSPDGHLLYFATLRDSTWDNWQAPVIPIVDFNGDGQVDEKDLLVMIEHWGQDYPLCDIGPFGWGDGTVDLQDLTVLAEYMGKEVVDPTLVAHWAFDEKEGTIAHDSAGKNDAVVVGNPVWQPAGGKVGGALQFDGKNDHVQTGPVTGLDRGTLSVLAWVKGGAPGQVVVYHANGAKWLYLNPTDGGLATELKSASSRSAPLVSKAVIADGQWHRIGVVWDGNSRILYADEKEVARDAQTEVTISGGGLMIGSGPAGPGPSTYWSGLIDDVRIYSRVVDVTVMRIVNPLLVER